MRGMIRPRSSRSLVALVTAMLLLMCQTAFAAQACTHVFTSAAADAISAPCHETPSESASPERQAPAASTSCEVAKVLPDGSKLPVFALSDLDSVAVAYLDAPPALRTSRALQTVQAVCHSPPLSILHCRFLN